MGDPLDAEARRQVEASVGGRISVYVAPASDIRRAIDKAYRALTAVDRHVEAFLATEALTVEVLAEREATDSAQVVSVVNLIITQGVRDHASGIHIEPQDSRVRTRYRIDGAVTARARRRS